MMRFLVLGFFLSLGPSEAEPLTASADLRPYQDRLRDILARREFRGSLRRTGPISDLDIPDWKSPSFLTWLKEYFAKAFRNLGDWIDRLLKEWFEGLFKQGMPNAPSGGWTPNLPKLAAWLIGIAAWWLLLYVLYRFFVRKDGGNLSAISAVSVHEPMLDALSKPIQEWQQAAERFVREGEWRLALRATYLAILALLHKRNVIRYSREKTNGEYVAFLAGTAPGEPFAALTLAFDQAWYGNKPFGTGEYAIALDHARQVTQVTALMEQTR